MADKLPVYSSREVEISFLEQSITGVADSFASIEQNSDFTNEDVGAFGEVGISISPDHTGMFELTLQQTSLANKFLANVIVAQRLAKTLYRGSLTLSDPSGSVLVQLRDCHIKKGPTLGFGSQAQDRTWTLFCSDYVYLELPEGMTESAAALGGVLATVETLSQFKA